MLKAVLFDFNGVIVNDESIHEKLIAQLLIDENLRPKLGEFRQVCLGRGDRACIRELFANRGRLLTDQLLDDLIRRKSNTYQQYLQTLSQIPSYPGLQDLIFNIRANQLKLAIVSGMPRLDIELVLEKLNLQDTFAVIIAAEDYITCKPDPESYLLAVSRLNQAFPELNLLPTECLAIEDSFAGITAAKQANIPVVGVANTYPFHMLQRQANWTVDYLSDLELDRVRQVYNQAAA